MKRWIAALIAVCLLCPAAVFAQDSGVRVTLNGADLSFDVPPVLENGRTLVPLRAIFEALGADVYWIEETETVVAVKNDRKVILSLGDVLLYRLTIPEGADVPTVAYHISTAPFVMLDVPAKEIDGRTLVPLRAVSDALGAEVEWDEAAQAVYLTCTEEDLADTNRDKGFFDTFCAMMEFGIAAEENPVMLAGTDYEPVLLTADFVSCTVSDSEDTPDAKVFTFVITEEGRQKLAAATEAAAQKPAGKNGLYLFLRGQVVAAFPVYEVLDTNQIHAQLSGLDEQRAALIVSAISGGAQ